MKTLREIVRRIEEYYISWYTIVYGYSKRNLYSYLFLFKYYKITFGEGTVFKNEECLRTGQIIQFSRPLFLRACPNLKINQNRCISDQFFI